MSYYRITVTSPELMLGEKSMERFHPKYAPKDFPMVRSDHHNPPSPCQLTMSTVPDAMSFGPDHQKLRLPQIDLVYDEHELIRAVIGPDALHKNEMTLYRPTWEEIRIAYNARYQSLDQLNQILQRATQEERSSLILEGGTLKSLQMVCLHDPQDRAEVVREWSSGISTEYSRRGQVLHQIIGVLSQQASLTTLSRLNDTFVPTYARNVSNVESLTLAQMGKALRLACVTLDRDDISDSDRLLIANISSDAHKVVESIEDGVHKKQMALLIDQQYEPPAEFSAVFKTAFLNEMDDLTHFKTSCTRKQFLEAVATAASVTCKIALSEGREDVAEKYLNMIQKVRKDLGLGDGGGGAGGAATPYEGHDDIEVNQDGYPHDVDLSSPSGR